MAIHIQWDNDEQTRFLYHFDAAWVWDEFFAAKDRAKIMMDAVSHKFAVIIDLTEVSRLPADSLARARNALRSGHPGAFFIVLVVPHPVVRTVIGTLRDIAPLSPRSIEIASSLDEARTMVDQHLLAYKPSGG
ncbi:MAG: hypothetical protein ABI690_14765 [Chloroflexota bacterium]